MRERRDLAATHEMNELESIARAHLVRGVVGTPHDFAVHLHRDVGWGESEVLEEVEHREVVGHLARLTVHRDLHRSVSVPCGPRSAQTSESEGPTSGRESPSVLVRTIRGNSVTPARALG